MKTVKIELTPEGVRVKGRGLSLSWEIGVKRLVEELLKGNPSRVRLLANVVDFLQESGYTKVTLQQGPSSCSMLYREKGTPWGKRLLES
jgi:hypothetical protein